MADVAEEAKSQYLQMVRGRDPFRDSWEMVSKYVFQRPISFGDTTKAGNPARISVKDVHDDTAADCSEAAAAAFAGALWPNVEESFQVVPHPMMRTSPEMKAILRNKEVKAYYAEITQRARQPFAHPDCNFLVSFSEHMSEQVPIGTSGLFGEEQDDNENPCYFRSVSIETAVIEEGPTGKIDTVAFEYQYTVRQIVEKYGIGKVSKAVRELHEHRENWNRRVRVIHLIRPRPKGKIGAPKLKKPWESLHFEFDEAHMLKRDGFDRLPVWISRFRKRPNEVYGRGLAMSAMPTIREMNVIRKSMNKALGLQLEPPVGIRTDQFGGADNVDLGMGGKTLMYDSQGMIKNTRPPVEKLLDVPEPRVANERMSNLEEKCMMKFLLDKLLDFNNKTRMTLGEAKIRTDFRNQALGSYFSRQMTEILHPAIMWAIGVHWERKLFGLHPTKDADKIDQLKRAGVMPLVMPKVVADFWDATGKLPFAIRFVSPAARAMAADSLAGLEQLTNYVLALVKGGSPEAIDNMDVDESVELYAHHVGAPPDSLRAQDDRDDARTRREQLQEAMAQLQAGEQQSTIEKNRAKAAKDNAQAGVQPGAMSIGA